MSEVFHSIFSTVEAFIYRCRNDKDYTMEYLEGAVQALSGFDTDELLQNRVASWVAITAQEDVERVFAIVDAAIETRSTWDVAYRIRHKSGKFVWVRERGNAVYEDGELAYLQGLIVSAAEEMALRGELESVATSTAKANSDIVALASRITASVRQLALLSVNARIEAARSGPAGAGFAVVADEMKTLADENGRWASIITEKLSTTDASLSRPS